MRFFEKLVVAYFFLGHPVCCPGLVGIRLPSWEGPDLICH